MEDITAEFEVSWPIVSQDLRVLKEAECVVEAWEAPAAFNMPTGLLSGAFALPSKITGGAALAGSRTLPEAEQRDRYRS